MDHPQASAIVRLDLAPLELPQSRQDVRTYAYADVVAPPPRLVQEPEQKSDEPIQLSSDAVAILPDLPQQLPKTARNEQRREALHIAQSPPLDAQVFYRGRSWRRGWKMGLTPEMIENFDLFLYVSKADDGPLSQRMYVYAKDRSGNLELLYDWAASTGREAREISPRGERTRTTTPAGFYELDPDRMYRSYHSYGWDQDMPDAMFFNWEREGLQTGLAIHAATGRDIERLARASAGCVHLAPQNAAILFDLIRNHYRGPTPRFAYDYNSQTMSNQGQLLHDRFGKLEMARGYRVLVRIENYGGGNDAVAALF